MQTYIRNQDLSATKLGARRQMPQGEHLDFFFHLILKVINYLTSLAIDQVTARK